MSDLERIDEVANELVAQLKSWGINAETVDGDVLITQGYLSELLEFSREWRSEIEELG